MSFGMQASAEHVQAATLFFAILRCLKEHGRTFELAANIHPKDTTGDRELLLRMGWSW